MTDNTFTTLEEIALSMIHGGSEVDDFLKSPSGEGNLTCEQAMAAHCSQKCTQGALDLLKKLKK